MPPKKSADFKIVFDKIDELFSPGKQVRTHDLTKEEADEIDELRRFALETEQPPTQTLTTT